MFMQHLSSKQRPHLFGSISIQCKRLIHILKLLNMGEWTSNMVMNQPQVLNNNLHSQGECETGNQTNLQGWVLFALEYVSDPLLLARAVGSQTFI